MTRVSTTICCVVLILLAAAGIAGAQGSLRVTVQPQEVILPGAQWKVVGTETWYNTGQVLTGLSAGVYDVEFRELDGWNTPTGMTVTVANSQTTSVCGRYTLPPGCVRAWGNTAGNQCAVPQPNNNFSAISAGVGNSLALKADGSIVSWGSNEYGKSAVPAPNANFVQASAGQSHSLGLKADGTVVAWGINYQGQGVPPNPNANFVAVSAGGFHNLALKADGSIAAWGLNEYGQCNVPSPNANFVAVSAGALHSTGLKADGTIVAWGFNGDGQLFVPALISDFTAVAGGLSQSMGLESDGSIRIWGSSSGGMLNIPQPNADYVAIAVQYYSAMALRSDSSIAAWGRNDWNQNTVPSPNNDFAAISCGFAHNLALQKPGALSVTLTPAGTGAQWRRVGTTAWFNGGDTETGIVPGDAQIEFSDVLDLITPAPITATINPDQTTEASAQYVEYAGVRVTILPQQACDEGAAWRLVGSPDWLGSGATVGGLRAHEYAIEFNSVGGWTAPAGITFTPVPGQTTEITVTYVAYGSIQGFIEPAEAASEGAQWRRVGTTQWLNSGDIETNVQAGDYTMEFKDITGWTKQSNINFRVSRDYTESITGVYERMPRGALCVYIDPEEARNAGAQWRRVGTEDWHNPGDTETDLLLGDYTVEFKDTPGWYTPATIDVTINQDETAELTGVYELIPVGSLRVYIDPQEAVDNGAQWRRVGTEEWFSTGDTEDNVVAGEYTVEFRDAPGWYTAGKTQVIINQYETAELWATYELMPRGALCVHIEPQEAADAGAQWRRVGTETWFNNGDVESDIVIGDYVVEFSNVAGWSRPENVMITVNPDETAESWTTYGPDMTIADMKLLSDEQYVGTNSAIVTAAWDGVFYIEAGGRACGIRVEKAGHTIPENTRASIIGTIVTTADGERVIQARQATENGSGSVLPLGLTNRAMGGGDFSYEAGDWPFTWRGQKGVDGATGLNNIGLLVRTWGNITSSDNESSPVWMVIDDGSGCPVKCELPAGVTVDPAWVRVAVNGISSCYHLDGALYRLLRVRKAEDITPMEEAAASFQPQRK